MYGDKIDQPVTWTGGRSLSALAGTPVRLRFVMRDADLYAIEFGRVDAAKSAAGSTAVAGER